MDFVHSQNIKAISLKYGHYYPHPTYPVPHTTGGQQPYPNYIAYIQICDTLHKRFHKVKRISEGISINSNLFGKSTLPQKDAGAYAVAVTEKIEPIKKSWPRAETEPQKNFF